MYHSGVQNAFRMAPAESGIHKLASVHTLGHSWATPPLEAGVNLRQLQDSLGHGSPSTTALYTQLTVPATQAASRIINEVFDRAV
jgi:site-specific recombinase XerD